MKKIIVIGSANTDMVVKTDKHPLPGETKMGGEFFMNAGGKGANQAVAAARLGGQVSFVAKVGNDIFGKQTLVGLTNENIDTSHVFIDDTAPSGTALIIVNAEGENSIVVAPGANAKLSVDDVSSIGDLSEAAFILMQLEIPIETITAVIDIARLNGKHVILNPAPAQYLSDAILNGLFLLVPNESEASLLTGIQVTDLASASLAADALIQKGVSHVIITLGKQGAYFKSAYKEFSIPAPSVIAVDTTAAGDTFCGALTVAKTEGKDWEDAIRFAITAASISVTRMGAQASVPYRNEINL
ncbi:MAG: ribokinase [Bacteroidetes bacterium]|nr:ribokinase [Bacteroidota bacterium]